jgi:eukaryotic-like serine/threonine-protein kinase
MTDRWRTIERVFHEALARPESERSVFVEASCGGDRELMRDVNSLLDHHNEETARLEGVLEPVMSHLFTNDVKQDHVPSGAMFGPYRIDSKLGEGGMGAVYIATDTRLDRQVAVKMVSRALAGTPDARARFLREARSAAALAHAHIATIHDLGETGERPWLVMEYVDGTPLRSKLLAGPVGEAALLRYAAQIAGALEHAHARQIIHRDIKPENILVTQDDNIKVIDFGLARPVRDESAPTSVQTQPHTFLGTLAYAAPELFSGGAVSARSDVYSLGVVLYEMACGEHPFARLTGPALISAILAGDRPKSKARNPLLSGSVAALIDRCMSCEAAGRFRNGAEVAAAIRNILRGEGYQQPDSAPACLAIMDFVNLGGSAAVDWLGTGIAETLSADLAKLKSVQIASRGRVQQAVRHVGDPQNDAAAAARMGNELGARWIVTGGYQQIGDRIRVTPKLIETSTGDVLSTEKIDGSWTDLFDVQDRVVAALLQTLAIGFGTTDRQKILPAETRNMLAYEHYIRGRQQMYQMQGKSLQAAIAHFEQAVALDPNYALAFSGLGTAHALQFIRTSDPEDVARASAHLERAIELDPELGEPYPWLANIRVRKNDPAGAVAAGAKAVELQPDLPEAHYFGRGLVYFLSECRLVDMRDGIAGLAETIRLEPKFHPAWIVFGAVAMFMGKHEDAAKLLSEAIRLEGEPDLVYRFVGARTMLAIALTRACDWDGARQQHLAALDALKSTDHIYRDTFRVLSTCGLGEIELRRGNERAALAHSRHAWQILKETPRIAGSARLLIRTSAGLSAAYTASGEPERARELMSNAIARLNTVIGNTATVTFECTLSHLYLALAVAAQRLGRIDEAAGFVQRARETGWRDLPWLLADPELRSLRDHAVFRAFVEELQSAPEAVLPMPVRFQSLSGRA